MYRTDGDESKFPSTDYFDILFLWAFTASSNFAKNRERSLGVIALGPREAPPLGRNSSLRFRTARASPTFASVSG